MRKLIPGERVTVHGVFLFSCPVCKREMRFDDAYGPMCTGPSDTLDEHAPTMMVLVGTARAQVYA